MFQTRITRFVLPAALALSVAAPALARPGHPPAAAQSKAEKRAKIEARLKQIRGQVLRKRVGLDEKHAKQVEGILDRYRPKRRALQKQMRTHRQAIGKLLKADSNDQNAYRREIAGMRNAKKQLDALRDREINEISRVITPKQQAKLAVALRRMQRRLHSAMSQYRGRHHGGGGPRPADFAF